jgi:tetratricopeptide (TPR) repeat protein
MRASKLLLVGVACVCAFLVPASAKAAVTVIGSGLARICYEHSESSGTSLQAIGDCDRALKEEALTSRDRAATFVNRGILHMRARRIAAALADYDSAIKVKSDLAEAYINKGIALVHARGRNSEAINAITQGLQLNPIRPEVAYYTRGVAHELLGNTRAAYDDYRQAAVLKPDWQEPKEQLKRFAVVGKPG